MNTNSKITKMTISVLLVILTFSAMFCGCSEKETVTTEITVMRQKFSDEKYIIHACGEIADESGEKYDYTNSMEALENSYSKGNRIVEIDFHYTSDHVLVCGHAWGDLYLEGRQVTPGEAPTFSDYQKCKVQDKFTVLTFDDVASFMQQHEDLIVVTDTKETDIDTYKMIAENYPELVNRFVVQIYHATEYDMVKKAGFPFIIYTLYEATDDELTEKALLKAAKKPLIGFTFHTDLADDESFMTIMDKTDTPKYVHTVNDTSKINSYLGSGIAGIYTDLTDLNTK